MKRSALLGVLVGVLALTASAPAPASATVRNSVVEVGERPGGGSLVPGDTGPLIYTGERTTMHNPKIRAIFWGSNFATTTTGKETRTMLLKFYEGLSGSAFQGILSQYFDTTANVSPLVSSVQTVSDESVAAPQALTLEEVFEEIEKISSQKGWTPDPDTLFVVLTAPGSTYDPGFLPNACAAHGRFEEEFIFNFIPFQGDPKFVANNCLSLGNPSGNPVIKTSKSASHEYAEANLNPAPKAGLGWRSPLGTTENEIADLCSSEPAVELPSGAFAQPIFDDHLGGCAVADANPPHAYANTEQPTAILGTGATMNGTVNPEGLATTSSIDFGLTTAYGSKIGELSAGSGRKNKAVAVGIGGLSPATTYHYRVVATNSSGSNVGVDRMFTTKPVPTVATLSATTVTTNEAMLNGSVNPNGVATTDFFEYGPTAAYGTKAPLAGESAGAGKEAIGRHFTITGLAPGATYHFRLVASNAEGATQGEDRTFTTRSLPPTFSSAFGSLGSGDGQFNEPTGIAINPINGVLAVSDEKNNRIEIFDQAGKFIRKFGSLGTAEGQFNEPRGVVFDAKGRLWVTDTGNNRVEAFSETGAFQGQFGTKGSADGQLDQPKGIAVDADGDLWVADSGNSRIQEFTSAGGFVLKFAAGANPIGVAVDGEGNVWSDNENEVGPIEEHSAGGVFIRKFSSRGTGPGQVSKPKRLAIGPAGEVWVPDSVNDRVEIFSAQGEFIAQFGSSGTGSAQMDNPVAVALEPSGGVRVADDSNHRVQRWIR